MACFSFGTVDKLPSQLWINSREPFASRAGIGIRAIPSVMPTSEWHGAKIVHRTLDCAGNSRGLLEGFLCLADFWRATDVVGLSWDASSELRMKGELVNPNF